MLVIIIVNDDNDDMMRNTIQYVHIKPLQIISVQLISLLSSCLYFKTLLITDIIICVCIFFHCVDNTKVWYLSFIEQL